MTRTTSVTAWGQGCGSLAGLGSACDQGNNTPVLLNVWYVRLQQPGLLARLPHNLLCCRKQLLRIVQHCLHVMLAGGMSRQAGLLQINEQLVEEMEHPCYC